jgi:hypothetical protein
MLLYTWSCSRRGRNLCVCIYREDYAQGDWGVSAALCWVHSAFSEGVLLMLIKFGKFSESWHFVNKIRIWVCSFAQLCSWGLLCSGMMCHVAGWLIPDVSGQSAHLKGSIVERGWSFDLWRWDTMVSWNGGHQSPVDVAQYSQKSGGIRIRTYLKWEFLMDNYTVTSFLK